MHTILRASLLCLLSYAPSLMPNQIDETIEQLEQANIQFVDFAFTGLLGNLYSITVPINRITSAFENGIYFDGSSIPGCTQIFESDMLLKADLKSLHSIPWLHEEYQKTARVMCNMYSDAHTPYTGSARNLLNDIVMQAYKMGFSFFVGAELEFFVLDDQGRPIDANAYCSAEQNIRNQASQRSLLTALANQNIEPEKIHHEVAPGQFEVVLRYNNPITMADNIIFTQETIKSWAQLSDMQATFMPKPIFGQNGSGMHIHFSLYDHENECNAFYDANDPYQLSTTAKQFIAGVLKYVPEFNALLNSTVNSYKRLVPGYEAPIYVCWGTKNRSALIRIPEFTESVAARAEIRSPDGLGNPYLVFATILWAGLEGIKQRLELEPALDRNLYKLSPEERMALNITALPTSLGQALDNLENSKAARNFLGDRLFDEFLKLKRKELRAFNIAVTDWEIKQYGCFTV